MFLRGPVAAGRIGIGLRVQVPSTNSNRGADGQALQARLHPRRNPRRAGSTAHSGFRPLPETSEDGRSAASCRVGGVVAEPLHHSRARFPAPAAASPGEAAAEPHPSMVFLPWVKVPFLANGMGPWIGSHPCPLRLEHLGRTCAPIRGHDGSTSDRENPAGQGHSDTRVAVTAVFPYRQALDRR